MKRFFSFVLFLVLGFVLAVMTAFSAGQQINTPFGLRVQLAPQVFTSVTAEENGEKWALYLPDGIDRKHLTVAFDTGELVIDGKPLVSGEKTDAFVQEGTHTVASEGKEIALQVYVSANIPAVFIETESGSLDGINQDRAHKETGTFSALENGSLTMNGAALEYMKGRGNSSWAYNEKRSYNLKFEKKTALFGMKPAKKWALISNNMDPSLMRNAIAYSAAQASNLPFAVHYAYVDLYVNGEYRGNYLLCEKIEVGKNRIAIADLDKANEEANPDLHLSDVPRMENVSKKGSRAWCDIPQEPENISGGYLLEYDLPEVFEEERSGFITKNGTCLFLHSPEHATKGEIDYVAALYEAFEEALLSKDGINAAGKHYSDYIDEDSFVEGLLLREITQNEDRGRTSWYIFLPQNEQRFYMGPVWDFDQSMRDAALLPDFADVLGRSSYERKTGEILNHEKTFLDLLYSHRDFVDRMSARFFEMKPSFFDELSKRAETIRTLIQSSAAMDAVRWGRQTEAAVDYATYISERMQRLETAFLNLDRESQQVYDSLMANDGKKDGAAQSLPGPLFVMIVLLVAVPVVGGIVFTAFGNKKGKNKKKESTNQARRKRKR